jgi:hypothetical protein
MSNIDDKSDLRRLIEGLTRHKVELLYQSTKLILDIKELEHLAGDEEGIQRIMKYDDEIKNKNEKLQKINDKYEAILETLDKCDEIKRIMLKHKIFY